MMIVLSMNVFNVVCANQPSSPSLPCPGLCTNNQNPPDSTQRLKKLVECLEKIPKECRDEMEERERRTGRKIKRRDLYLFYCYMLKSRKCRDKVLPT
ncbi:hypothetical protein L484_016228 [Morus notabilis]|uniref:Uncharacterized protein n=1 Tax=Morus notabilis TaxID=981085 RepID=W9R0B9_9ROSA|nr:hypothetical protein L484_016228 [Morus notabilis]